MKTYPKTKYIQSLVISQHNKLLFLFIGFALVAVFIFSTKLASALTPQETNTNDLSSLTTSSDSCGNSPFNGTGTFHLPADKYSVYVKLGNLSKPETDALYAKPDHAPCQIIGRKQLSSKEWTKVGTYNTKNGGEKGEFQLSSLTTGILQSLNQPSIMLVSATNPACQPTTECFVKIGEHQGVIQPTPVSGTDNTLFVFRAVSLSQDKLSKVDYYVDDIYAYSTDKFEPFSMHYVGFGKHTLTTIAHYNSGQEVVVTQNKDRTLNYKVKDLATGVFYKQRGWLQYLFSVVLALLILSTLMRIIRYFHRKSRWKRDHDASLNALTPMEQFHQYLDREFHPYVAWVPKKLSKIIVFVLKEIPLIFIVLFGLVLLNKYAITFKQVAGVSMNHTFHDGEFVLVNRLGQTQRTLLSRNYIPKRGDVVILRRSLSLDQKSYLGDSEFLIKRVIGLPGDRVVVKNGVVTIYNKQHKNGFHPDKGAAWEKTMVKSDSIMSQVNKVDVQLQPNTIFVMGDNRPDSIDSRAFGPIKIKDVLGNVFFEK